jgi:polysaccharide pyruvyl transferase WcaK-like protein
MDMLGRWPLSEVVPLVAAKAERGTPVAFIGIGTERLQRDESRRLVASGLAPQVRHWSVRSEQDRERLLDYGVTGDRVTVAADLAWTLERSPEDASHRRPQCLQARPGEIIVGVNVTNERFVSQRAPRLLAILAEFLDRLVEKRGARIVFFCNEIREDESFDKAASQRIIGHMRHPERTAILPNEYRTPQQMMTLLDACHLAVGMRYHFCVFAAIQGVPFIAIKRSDKVDDLCRDLTWAYGVGLDEIDASLLEVQASELLADPPGALGRMLGRVESMRARVWRNCAALDVLRDPKGR